VTAIADSDKLAGKKLQRSINIVLTDDLTAANTGLVRPFFCLSVCPK